MKQNLVKNVYYFAELNQNIRHIDKDVKQKLDKIVTRVVKLLSLSNKSGTVSEDFSEISLYRYDIYKIRLYGLDNRAVAYGREH